MDNLVCLHLLLNSASFPVARSLEYNSRPCTQRLMGKVVRKCFHDESHGSTKTLFLVNSLFLQKQTKPKHATSYVHLQTTVYIFEQGEKVTACDLWVQVDHVCFLWQGIPGTDGLPGEMGKAGAPVSFLLFIPRDTRQAEMTRCEN